MHPHEELIDRLYRSLNAHDHDEMAECYHEEATFHDIANRFQGEDQIHDMWKLVTCEKLKLKATFGIIRAQDNTVHAWLIDDYLFPGPPSRPVINVILSFFRFRTDSTGQPKIIEHRDVCDPILWANMAMTGAKAWLAGHFRLARTVGFKIELSKFLQKKSPYNEDAPVA